MKFLMLLTVSVVLVSGHPVLGQDKQRTHQKNAEEKPTQEEMERIEIFELGQKPSKSFQLISPVSAKEDNEEKAFKELKIAAAKLKADAIIDYHCGPVNEESLWTGATRVRSYCNGKAVQWTVK